MFAATLPSDPARLEQDEPGLEGGLLPRSFGAIDLEFCHKGGATRVQRAFQQGVMRVRFPNVPRGAAPEAVLINTAGGLTGGDGLNLNVNMGAGTQAVVTTQAHEKIYRSARGDASVTARIKLHADAALDWLPQPTILFDGARLDRETHVEMTGAGCFLGVEAVIFGRTAMDEVVRSGALADHWTIQRDGRLVHADRFALCGDMDGQLARPALLAGNAAMATIRYVAPGAQARLDDMRALLAGDGAASAWNGMLLARLVAANGYGLGKVLARVLTGFRGRALPPAWHI